MGEEAGAVARTAVQNGLDGDLTALALGYQRLLEHEPGNVEALLGLGLVALSSGQVAQAVVMARAGVRAAPRLGAAWITLGQALKADRKFDEAETAYLQAIRLDGMDPLARMGMGELRIAQERPTEAMAEFELALQRQPNLAAARMGIGNAHAQMKQFERAIEQYEQALLFKPNSPDVEFAIAFALMRLGRNREAEQRYQRVLRLRPDFAAAWLNLGCLQREAGKDVLAQAALLRAVELRPDLTNGWINLGLVERDRQHPERAEVYLRRAFALGPEHADTLVAWCQFREAEGDHAGACGWLRWALARDPKHAEGWNMQGILLHNEGRFAEAVEAFKRAEALGHRAAVSNRGNTLLDMGRVEEALEAHQKAADLDLGSSGALYNLALTQLRMGRWAEGWQHYEARWRFRQVHRGPRIFKQPRWQGEGLHGERVLLHGEQGLGDTIQFCRYAALVAARGGHPLLLVQKGVQRLMQSLPVVRSGEAEVALPGTPAHFDLECPLLSLPAVFGATVETVPWNGAYLSADPEEVREKLRQFPSSGAGPRIGIAWAGNPRYRADSKRSMKLETLLPLLRTSGFEWVALQKGKAAAQLLELPEGVHVIDGSSHEQNLAETAALMATLDAVVTSDTCIAHLAGAMNKPVWILLPHLSDWRWMQEIETSPWYPSARLMRQSKPGDWLGVLERVAGELQIFRRTMWRAAC